MLSVIWLDAFRDYPNYSKIKKNLNKESVNYIKKLNLLTKRKAKSLENYLKNNFAQKKSLKFNGLFDELTPILLKINKRPEEVT